MLKFVTLHALVIGGLSLAAFGQTASIHSGLMQVPTSAVRATDRVNVDNLQLAEVAAPANAVARDRGDLDLFLGRSTTHADSTFASLPARFPSHANIGDSPTSVVPTPGTVVLLGVAGLFTIRRGRSSRMKPPAATAASISSEACVLT